MRELEEFSRRIRNVLDLYELLRERGGKTICLTSGKVGVGKTTIAFHLALKLAEKDCKTALFDFDFFLPNIHHFLEEVPSSVTLTHYLSGLAAISDLNPIKIKVGAGLSIFVSKSVVDLGRKIEIEKIARLLKFFKREYECLIIDLPSGMSKYAIYPITLSDFILLVTCDDRPSRLDAGRIKKVLQNMGLKVDGIVVNKVKGKLKYFRKDEIFCIVPYDKKLSGFEVRSRFKKSKGIKSIELLAEKVLHHYLSVKYKL